MHTCMHACMHTNMNTPHTHTLTHTHTHTRAGRTRAAFLARAPTPTHRGPSACRRNPWRGCSRRLPGLYLSLAPSAFVSHCLPHLLLRRFSLFLPLFLPLQLALLSLAPSHPAAQLMFNCPLERVPSTYRFNAQELEPAPVYSCRQDL